MQLAELKQWTFQDFFNTGGVGGKSLKTKATKTTLRWLSGSLNKKSGRRPDGHVALFGARFACCFSKFNWICCGQFLGGVDFRPQMGLLDWKSQHLVTTHPAHLVSMGSCLTMFLFSKTDWVICQYSTVPMSIQAWQTVLQVLGGLFAGDCCWLRLHHASRLEAVYLVFRVSIHAHRIYSTVIVIQGF